MPSPANTLDSKLSIRRAEQNDVPALIYLLREFGIKDPNGYALIPGEDIAKKKKEKSMVRIVLGVIAGFFAWVTVWVGSEKILSAILPEWYGAPQLAFQAAVENGGKFTAETRLLLTHIVIGSIVSVMSGSLAALVASENKHAPLALGILLLLAIGLVKVVMSWPYVPIWYHVIFTALLIPMTIIGGKLITAAQH